MTGFADGFAGGLCLGVFVLSVVMNVLFICLLIGAHQVQTELEERIRNLKSQKGL